MILACLKQITCSRDPNYKREEFDINTLDQEDPRLIARIRNEHIVRNCIFVLKRVFAIGGNRLQVFPPSHETWTERWGKSPLSWKTVKGQFGQPVVIDALYG